MGILAGAVVGLLVGGLVSRAVLVKRGRRRK
jgi:hypothetical protein